MLQSRSLSLVLALTPRAAQAVLSAPPDGYGPWWEESFSGLVGPGSLWVLKGERHRAERQILTPPFHASNYRRFGLEIQATAQRHIEGWNAGQQFRALDRMTAISLDVITSIVLGDQTGELMAEARRVVSGIWHNMHPAFVFFPALQSWWFPPWARYQRAKRDFSEFVDQLLARRGSSPGENGSLLARMLEARYEDGSAMTDEDIRDELVTILLSGHETTATALAWALYELGRHPSVLARLRSELDALGPRPDPDAIARQPFLNAVCNETLRSHTVLAEIARTTLRPVQILDYMVPQGVGLGVSINAVHHDPDTYPDPDLFRPDRFLNRSYGPSEFMPFGGGHRRCPGAGLSDYEMRIVLATVLTAWEYEVTREDYEIRHDIAMGPRHGVRLRLIKRRTKATMESKLSRSAEA